MLDSDVFWSKVNQSGACWLWLGMKNKQGHGLFKMSDGEMIPAHRYAYTAINGYLAANYELEHTCQQNCCVNPAHMRAFPKLDKARIDDYFKRSTRRRKNVSHCSQGHELTADAKFMTISGTTFRVCNVCKQEQTTKLFYSIKK